MIEKKIHYCWFGGGTKNDTIINCIKSWTEYLPDYEICEWNELNCDFDNNFSKHALHHKKWAFLSDYIRLKVLYTYGGIYLDTDMLVLKPFNDLLSQQCFLGYQDNGQVNGSIIGSVRNNDFIKACLDRYELIIFDETRLMSMAIPEIITEVYSSYSNKQKVKVYAHDYFYPYSFGDSQKGKSYLECVKPETYAIHLWNASWFTEKELAGFAFENKEWLKGITLFGRFMINNPRQIVSLPSLLWRKAFKRKV